MKRVSLSKDISVSGICLGAMNFGTTTDKTAAYRMLDAFTDVGGNFIDTSNNYAHWQGTGDESEMLLGQWLSERGCREKVVLATKVGFDRHGQGAGLKKEQIEYWIDQSLAKLRTDYVDLYYAHTDDAATPLEETMEAFDRLVQKGKVRLLGGSNYDTWRFAEANAVAEKHNLTGYAVMQQRYSYLNVRGDAAPKYIFNEFTNRERLRYLAAKKIPLVAYSCLARGGYEHPEKLENEYLTGNRLAMLQSFARQKGISNSAAVVAYLFNLYRCADMPQIIPLFASSSAEQLMQNLQGALLTLSDEELQLLLQA